MSFIDYQRLFDEVSANYTVPNLNLENAEYVFLLESPHKAEVQYGVPVAGASGRMMTKVLFGDSEPLGKLVAKISDIPGLHDRLNKIGLMNVCQIPLQASAYPAEAQEKYVRLFEVLEKIRTNHSKQYQKEDWNIVRNIIQFRFKEMLSKIVNKNYTIITCGSFAKFHLESSGISSGNWSVIHTLHPSRNQWYQNTESILQLKELFQA